MGGGEVGSTFELHKIVWIRGNDNGLELLPVMYIDGLAFHLLDEVKAFDVKLKSSRTEQERRVGEGGGGGKGV